jgi:hypothetical protein
MFRLLGGLSIIFGLAELLVTLTDPIETLYTAINAVDFSLGEFFRDNWFRWLQAIAVLLVAIGSFCCFLRPTRTRLLILALSLVVLINVFYIVLICIGISRALRSGQYDPIYGLKIALQTIVETIFPVTVILIARARRRQLRTQD